MRKRCSMCEKRLLTTSFWKDQSRSDGLQRQCKKCLSGNMRRLREARRKKGVQSPTRKRCSLCTKMKRNTMFYKNFSSSDGLHAYCKLCFNDRNRQLQARFSYGSAARLRKYGLTVEQYLELEKLSGGKCSICERPFAGRPSIDHCHKTGRVRGLLCKTCNLGLGNLLDDPAVVGRALAYLQQNAVG